MLNELSLHILDVANNSLRAKASLVKIDIEEKSAEDLLIITIEDDGCGMTKEKLASVIDPFFTTRTTRNIGLGIPFFKMAAELSEGSFEIKSEQDVGTVVAAVFKRSHINRMPMGDIATTFFILAGNEDLADICYTHTVDGKSFTADTREFKEILGDIPLSAPEVSIFIREYIEENLKEISN